MITENGESNEEKEDNVREEDKNLSIAATFAGVMFCTLASLYQSWIDELFQEGVESLLIEIGEFTKDQPEVCDLEDHATLGELTEIISTADHMECDISSLDDISDLIAIESGEMEDLLSDINEVVCSSGNAIDDVDMDEKTVEEIVSYLMESSSVDMVEPPLKNITNRDNDIRETFKCDICFKEFALKDSLKRHKKNKL